MIRDKEPDQLLQSAKAHLEKDRYAKACNLFERVIEIERWNGEAHYGCGLAFIKRRRYEQAILRFQQALNQGFDEAQCRLGMGRAYVGLEKPDEAIVEFTKATEASPKFAEAYDEAGLACMAKYAAKKDGKDLDAAIAQYSKAISADPRSATAYLHLAEAYDAKGDYAQYLNSIEKTFEIEPTSQEMHDAILRVFPRLANPDEAVKRIQGIVDRSSDVPVFVKWGDTLLALEKTESAFQHFLKAIQLVIESKQALDQVVLSSLERAVIRLSNPQAAIEQVRSAIALTNISSDHGRWANALIEIDQLDEGMNQIMMALRRAPLSEDTWQAVYYTLSTALPPEQREQLIGRVQSVVKQSTKSVVSFYWGEILYELKHYDQSIQHLTHALEQKAFPQAYFTLGRCLITQGKFSEAAVHILKSIQLGLKSYSPLFSWSVLDPWEHFRTVLKLTEDPKVWMDRIQKVVEERNESVSFAEWGRTLAMMDRSDDALLQLEAAITRDAACVTAYEALKEQAEKLKKKNDLVERLSKVISESQNALAHGQWGEVLNQLDHHREAAQCFSRAAELEEDEAAKYHHSAGRAYAECEEFNRAFVCYRRVIDADPAYTAAYTSLADALGQEDKQEGVVGKLSRIFAGEDFATISPERWDEIHAAKLQQEKRAEALCSTIERNIDQDSAWIYADCGYRLRDHGLYQEALRLIEGAAKLKPKSIDYAIGQAGQLERLGQYQEAIAKYDEAIKLDPTNSQYFLAQWGRARLFGQRQQFQEACDAFKDAFTKISQFSDEKQDVQNQANAYIGWASALEELRQYDKALAKCDQALKLLRDGYWAHFQRARILSSMRLYEQAIGQYEKAIQPIPKDDAFKQEKTDQQEDEKKAEYIYEKAYPLHNIAVILDVQARYGEGRKKWKEACGVYQKHLIEALYRRDAYYFGYYGYALLAAFRKLNREPRSADFRELGGAEALYRAGLVLDPSNAQIHALLVDLYLEKKKSSTTAEAKMLANWKAFDCYQSAVGILERRRSHFEDAATLVELGKLHLQMEETEKANKTLKDALKKDDRSVRPRKGLGELFVRTKQYNLAIQHFKAFLQCEPDDLNVRAALAQAYLKSKLLEDAEAGYRSVLDISRSHVESLIGLGETYLAMADEQVGKKGAIGTEDLYLEAIDLFSEAIQTSGSEDRSKTLMPCELAPIYYLRGYVRVQLYDSARLMRDSRLLRDARKDFHQCINLDSNYSKARRAIGKIKQESPRFSRVERWTPTLVIAISLIVLVLAQVGLSVGLPVLVQSISLQNQPAGLAPPDISSEIMAKLKELKNISFKSHEVLMARAKDLLGEKDFERVKDLLLGSTFTPEKVWDFERIKIGDYLILTFGGLLFLIAGAYLPQLKTFKVGGVLQLDKSASEQIETVRSIGISK